MPKKTASVIPIKTGYVHICGRLLRGSYKNDIYISPCLRIHQNVSIIPKSLEEKSEKLEKDYFGRNQTSGWKNHQYYYILKTLGIMEPL